MRVLFIVPYPKEGPSNRFRVEQYLPYLKAEGIGYSLRPFFSSRSYKILYKRGFFLRKLFYFVIFFFSRLRDVLGSHRYSLVFIHREVFPFGSFMEYFLRLFSRKILYDFDDAIFLPNVSESNKLVRVLKDAAKTQKIARMSNWIIAGNGFLNDYALKFNKNISILPTPIDTDKYRPLAVKKTYSSVVVGWIGSATTLQYLDILTDVLKDLLKRYDYFNLVVVGGVWNRINSPRVISKEWRLDSEICDLQSFDIGIMPLKDDDWSRGKCSFKIIEYMSVGIPVVASAVGMNNEVIRDGVNGFLAVDKVDWFRKLSRLLEDAKLRAELGKAGRKTVEDRYSLKVNAPKFIKIIRNV